MRSGAVATGLCAATALAAVGLAGCGEDPDARRNQDRPAVEGTRYVALGDSYVSGPALGPTTGPAGCLRTTRNYPHLLAQRLDLDLVDASCGGATTGDLSGDVTGGQEVGEDEVPPQLDALTDDTRLVTLGIGANDEDVFATSVAVCARLARRDPGGSPCADAAQASGGDAAERIDDLEDDLTDAVGEILERAPRARVLLVGYPQVVPARGRCAQIPLARGDYAFVRRVLGLLNTALRTAAGRAGAEYVDVAAASRGHDACSAQPWVAGHRPTSPAHPFHPYRVEARAVADLLAERLEDGRTEKRERADRSFTADAAG